MSNTGQTIDVLPDPWVMRLRGTAQERDAAISELRDLLVRGLSKSMASRYHGAVSAEDVVQEALLKILDSLDQFKGRSRFTTWAMTVATRTGISQMRRKHFRDVSLNSTGDEESRSYEFSKADRLSVSDALDQQAMLEQLRRLIAESLTEKQRLAIMASLDGMPVETIAEKLGSNRNSVYKLVHDARLRLRSGLMDAGFSADDLVDNDG